MSRFVLLLVKVAIHAIRTLAMSRQDLVIENIALRQQVATLKQERPRPNLDDADRGFWVALRSSWSGWANRLVIVKPETVVRWHRERFSRHWRTNSQPRRSGRPRIEPEVRSLIRQMAADGWGAPRIHGELLKLGFDICEMTVSRYMPRHPAEPDQLKRWLAFLRNHKDDIAAMDFFTVPTASLRVLYCFFVIHHGRRKVLHFNATFNPTSVWVIQQLRDAFPYDTRPRHLVFDRDWIFSAAVVGFVKAMGATPCRTPSAVLGRILWRSAGSEEHVERSSTTSWWSTRGTPCGLLGATSATSTTTEPTLDWPRTRPREKQ